jgi:hypothetical protein
VPADPFTDADDAEPGALVQGHRGAVVSKLAWPLSSPAW